MDEFDVAVEIFNQSRAAFHPVAAVQVLHAANRLDLGAVDVAADDAVGLVAARHPGESVLVIGDVFHGGLGLGFQIGRQRPVAEAQRAAQAVEMQVEIQNPVVKVRAEFFQQVVEMRQAVRLMAVDDEIFFAVRRGVDDLVRHHHAAETHPGELVDELIVVAGDINDFGLLAAFAEQFLDEDVVVAAPEPAELQLPAVNEIADEVEVLAIHHAQKVQQLLDAGVLGAEMDVGNPDRAADDRLVGIQIEIWLVSVHIPTVSQLCKNPCKPQSICGVVAQYSPARNAGVTIPLSNSASGQSISSPPSPRFPGGTQGWPLCPTEVPPKASRGIGF